LARGSRRHFPGTESKRPPPIPAVSMTRPRNQLHYDASTQSCQPVARSQFMSQLSALIHFFVCLSDKVLILFPSREIERVKHELGTLSLPRFQIFVFLFNGFAFDVLAHFESRISSADNRDVINNTAVFHFTVRTLNKPILIDAGVTTQ